MAEPNRPANKRMRRHQEGVTLIEVVVVTLLIALMAGISFPAINSGLDSLRLNAAARGIASFLNSGLNRAERREQAVEMVISPSENRLWMISSEPGFRRDLKLPDAVTIIGVQPQMGEPDEGPRTFFLYPGGTVPAIEVVLRSQRGVVRSVRLDPVTGVPSILAPRS